MSEKTLKLILNDDDPYTRVPNVAMRDARIPLAARGFFALLLGLPRDRELSFKYFVKVSGVNKDTACRYMRILEDYGYIKRRRARGEHGTFATNVYELYTSPHPKKPDMEKPDMVFPDMENPDTKEETLERKNIPPISPQGDGAGESAKDSEERFEAFWRYYRDTYCALDHSRAGSKAKAKKAWDKLKVTDELARRIWAYLEAKMRTEMWKRGIGIQYASSFLNDIARGDVDLTPVPPTPPSAPLTTREEDRWL